MPGTEPTAAMRVGRHFAQRVLLRTGAGERGEPRLDAAVGRAASGASGLWEPATDGAVACERAGKSIASGWRGLLELMGVEVVYPKRNLSQPGEGHRIYPYLLEGLEISGPDQVWCSDITYVPMAYGFMYLVAVMDWWSRYVLAWELSNSLDSEFCIRAWTGALASGRQPLISNTDQGSQFTSEAYLDAVESAGVDVSMDGRGRWIDNRFIERLWRSVKQEDIYVQDYGDGLTAQRGLARWFGDYNTVRPHQALEYATPGELYHSPESYGAKPAAWRWK